jgi:AraC family transcriptional regulator
MRFQTVRTKPYIRRTTGHRSLQIVGVEHDTDHRGLYEEQTWRRPVVVDGWPPIDGDILISRWVDRRNFRRYEKTVSPSDRHVIGVALKTTRLKFTRGPRTIFDGIMRAGTLHVTGPSQLLTAEFCAPCDFIHFHVSSDYLRERQDAAGVGLTQPTPDLNDLIICDPLAELLGRTLVESSDTRDGLYAESVGKTLVMHIARMELSQPTASALPKWRLKRVQEYVNAHLDEALSLADLAAVAGLSRMYFAGQFRAATGYRPHDYLLYQRIESAKSILSSTDMPLTEVALSVGFQAHAHFSTVFKRLTGQSPARWRRVIRSERQFPDTFVCP